MAKLPYRAIPAPVADVNSLYRTVEALREAVEMLTRQRGDEKAWPPTVDELRRMGIIAPLQSLPDAPEDPPKTVRQ